MATRKVDFSKHSGVIGYFRREYIKTGIFAIKYSDYLGHAFQFRTDCDYEDFIIVSREDAMRQYEQAVEFYDAVKAYLDQSGD